VLTGTPDVVAVGQLEASGDLVATARLIGLKIRTRELAGDSAFAGAAATAGLAFVFRYGVVVTFGSPLQGAEALDAALAPHIDEPIEGALETEQVRIIIRPGEGDRIGPDGSIVLADASRDRMELVATVLSRSVVLARNETLVSEAFDASTPLVSDLRENGRVRLPIRRVMRQVGNVLAARHRVTGMVQASERPDLLWDHPELDRLYVRLDAEYELGERAGILDRKFGALGDFSEALLDIVQEKRAVRLEAAIIVLIAFEILLSLYELALR